MQSALLVLALLAAGCASDTPVAQTATDAPSDDRPATTEVEIQSETDAWVATVTLADFPDFPVPFSTYILDDMTVEQAGSGDAIVFEIGAIPESGLDALASLTIYTVLDGSAAQQTADRLQREAPGDIRWTNDGREPGDGDWFGDRFVDGFGYVVDDVYTNVGVGEHDGTVYVVEETYDTRDDSRVQVISDYYHVTDLVLTQWRWADGAPFFPAAE